MRKRKPEPRQKKTLPGKGPPEGKCGRKPPKAGSFPTDRGREKSKRGVEEAMRHLFKGKLFLAMPSWRKPKRPFCPRESRGEFEGRFAPRGENRYTMSKGLGSQTNLEKESKNLLLRGACLVGGDTKKKKTAFRKKSPEEEDEGRKRCGEKSRRKDGVQELDSRGNRNNKKIRGKKTR